MTDFSQLLNPEQCAAATAGDGPILVLAAAGTGKTRTLVHRVAYLVEQGVSAERILLLTFTNRAAKEMLERAQQVVGPEVTTIWSGTFHHVAARLLRRFGHTIGYKPGFTILDEDDQKKLIGEIIKEHIANPKEFAKKETVAKIISEAANESKPVAFIAARSQSRVADINPEAIAMIAEFYDQRKRQLGAMDFDDLLVKALELLKSQNHIREMLQEHFLHVLVDEYQDTNVLQAEFVDILAARHRNVMAVGDDFQCIYTWRGAKIENILDFPHRWPGCRIVKLERNYRSVPGVLNLANEVMKDAPGQFEKRLRPVRTGSDVTPLLTQVYDGRTQAQAMLEALGQLRGIGYRWRDIAVLYRSHFHSIDIQMTLARERVPFRITSGVGVFEQVHTKDVLAYLHLVVNPEDELSFLRLVQLLPGVGEKSAAGYWKKFGDRFDGNERTDRERLGTMLGAKARPVWPQIAKCFEVAHEHLEADAVGEVVEDFVDLFYDGYANREWDESEAEDRLNDVRELSAQIAGAEGGLTGFLADVALFTNLDFGRNRDPSLDLVTLSTVHQAKGMEWPVVLVPWVAEGMFPSGKAAEEGRLDEERRLFYVALTRAKDRLLLYSPQWRKMADGGMFPVEMSPFIRGVSAPLLRTRRFFSA